MALAWGLLECPTPCSLGTSLQTKWRRQLVDTGWTASLLYLVVTKICLECLWLVRDCLIILLHSLTSTKVGRLNRPGIMVYGGTTKPGSCAGLPQLDIVSAFQSYGKYLQDGRTAEAERERYDTVRHACPGPGACGGASYLFIILHHSMTCFTRCTPRTLWPALQKHLACLYQGLPPTQHNTQRNSPNATL